MPSSVIPLALMVPARLVRVLLRFPSLISTIILLPSKGVSNTSSLSISLIATPELLPGSVKGRMSFQPLVLITTYMNAWATTIRPSVERVSRSVQTCLIWNTPALWVFEDIVQTATSGNSGNRIRKFSMCCFKCRYGFIAPCPHQAPASRLFACSNAILALGLFSTICLLLNISMEFLYQPVYNGRFPLLSQLLPALQSISHPHKSVQRHNGILASAYFNAASIIVTFKFSPPPRT